MIQHRTRPELAEHTDTSDTHPPTPARTAGEPADTTHPRHTDAHVHAPAPQRRGDEGVAQPRGQAASQERGEGKDGGAGRAVVAEEEEEEGRVADRATAASSYVSRWCGVAGVESNGLLGIHRRRAIASGVRASPAIPSRAAGTCEAYVRCHGDATQRELTQKKKRGRVT